MKKDKELNKKTLKKREYIYIALFALFCPIAILAFVSSVVHIEIKELVFSAGHLLSIVGIIVSTVGLIFTVYFVVLAVSAREIRLGIDKAQDKFDKLNEQKELLESKIEVLDETKNNIQTDLNSLASEIEKLNKSTNEYENSKKELEKLLNDYAQSLYDSLEYQISFAELSDKSQKLRNDLYLAQARLYRYPALDKEIRKKLLRLLAEIGEKEDIDSVKRLIFNSNEDEEIKEYALLAFNELNKKFENLEGEKETK